MTPLGAEQARALVTEAVRIPSVSGSEGAVSAFLSDWMNAHGFRAHVDASGSAVGERGSGPVTVVLLGHIDTVPGDIPVRVDGNEVLHGRGSVDAKGSFCTFVAAVAGLDADTLALARFVCVGATEEEVPSSRGAHHAVTQYRPDAVLIGEPSGWEGLTLGYKGRLVLHAAVRKDNFHTAGEGTSAGDDLTEAWFRVRAWAQERSGAGIFGAVQATVQGIESGTDGLMQTARGVFGLRLPPEVPPQLAQQELMARLDGLCEVDFRGAEVAVRHPKDSVLARALRLAIRDAGGTPVYKLKTGTSDMNVVAPHWDAPTLAYGPGDSRLDHTPEECLPLQEYDRAVAVLRDALGRVARSLRPR
ncbi:[LysW]-lysine hydrolase [Deinococcus aquiradiocola]|uniref:[LysW]-lysine hydrolase n=1 Tax=Deinococcus aquiradiocola TaxID=393059 RepID=A0A917PP39_9DEIO|nr:[LysW]-lysine hydrolase [Deinococcus aquiradiocola]GGJ86141.1 N-acetyl-lysine deacetylase [Deinococcus aquiradiocola]